jgi:predicted nucleic acid-binding protein
MIVLDASILAHVIGDDGSDGELARELVANEPAVSLPDLADVETASVLRKRWLADDLDARRFAAAIEDLAALPFPRYPALPFLRRAYELRENLTPYDAVYVALAEALGCTLVTADRRLARAPGVGCAIEVITPHRSRSERR